MPINTSRYPRSVEWDGPKKPSRKPVFADASIWRKRFYILLIVSLALILSLGGVVGYMLWKDRSATTKTQEITTTDTTDVASWKKSENSTVGLTFLYPPDWKLTQNTTTSDLDLFNAQVAGTGTNGATATVKVDAIKNASNLSLADWVKQFGPKDIQTESSRIANESALLAKFFNSETGEEQNVYYVLKNSNVYVFDLYQSTKDETLQRQLKDFAANVSFTTIPSETTTSDTESPANKTTTMKLMVNTVATAFDDEFSLYGADGTGKSSAFSDKDEQVYLKGSADVYTKSGTFGSIVGYFGASGNAAKDGIYSVLLFTGNESSTSKSLLNKVVSGVKPGLVRASRDGSVIGYLDGEKGVAKKIVLVDSSGEKISTITSASPVQYFAISSDGKNIAYVTSTSATIKIVGQDGNAVRTLQGFITANIFAFDWQVQNGIDKLAFVSDGSKFTNKSELYYIEFNADGSVKTQIKKITNDNVAQDNPRLNLDATKIAYQSYTSGTSGKTSVWVIGIDGKNDTSIAKSGNNLIAGWLLEEINN